MSFEASFKSTESKEHSTFKVTKEQFDTSFSHKEETIDVDFAPDENEFEAEFKPNGEPFEAEFNVLGGGGGDINIDLSGYAKKEDIPTKVSELENDSGYITEHQSLEEYAKLVDLDSKADLVDGKVPIEQLPDNLGSDVDLSDYYNKNEIDSALKSKADLVDGIIPWEQLPPINYPNFIEKWEIAEAELEEDEEVTDVLYVKSFTPTPQEIMTWINVGYDIQIHCRILGSNYEKKLVLHLESFTPSIATFSTITDFNISSHEIYKIYIELSKNGFLTAGREVISSSGSIVTPTPPENPDTGGSTAPVKWEDIVNKPFYEYNSVVVLVDNETTTSLDVSEGGGIYVIAFEIPSIVNEGVITILFDGVSYELEIKYNAELETHCFGNASIMNRLLGTSFEDTGEPFIGAMSEDSGVFQMFFYLADTQETEHAVSASVNSEAIKPLDIKYLPKNMALGYEERAFEDIVWDGNTDELVSTSYDIDMGEGVILTYTYYKVSDEFIPATRASGAELANTTLDGEDTSILSSDSMFITDADSWMDTMTMCVVSCCEANDTFIVESMGLSFTFPEVGTYFLVASMGEEIMARAISLVGVGTIKQIDEKFIPDTIARKSDLNSLIQSLDSALISAIGSGVLS